MSKEATGQMGAIIGSDAYWGKINNNTLFGGLMGSRTDYQAAIGQLGAKAAAAIEEIYEDLSNLGGKIRYLPSSDRNDLAKQVEGLYDICKMSGVTVWHNSECVHGLNLSIMSPWTSSFRDERSIERAIEFIERSRFSGDAGMKLLQEAAGWSISFAADGDREKQEFLEAVAQGNLSNRFLQDVADEYQNRNTIQQYEGRCGYPVGSKAYMTHLESEVFGKELPILICAASGNPDYEKLIKDALNSVADQLGRDLDNAIRENDYITNETADKLKAVVSELDHCGVTTGWLNSKIEKLAWFVGGDPAKITELQKALNDLGAGQHLKEDGVYGEKTESSIDRLIDNIQDSLKDPNKLRFLSVAVDATATAGVAVISQRGRALNDAVKKNWRLLWNVIWDLGAEYYLRPRGYDVAALLLQHSLENNPKDLHFSQSHWVTQKIVKSKGFRNAFAEIESGIRENPDTYVLPASININFQESGDTDLYYGIGKCKINCTSTKSPSSVLIKFTIDDIYNFDETRVVQVDSGQIITDFGLGSIANDLGFLSQRTKVISTYHSYIEFKKTIDLN